MGSMRRGRETFLRALRAACRHDCLDPDQPPPGRREPPAGFASCAPRPRHIEHAGPATGSPRRPRRPRAGGCAAGAVSSFRGARNAGPGRCCGWSARRSIATATVIGTFDWTLERGEHWHVCGPNGSANRPHVAAVRRPLACARRPARAALAGLDAWKRATGLVSPELAVASMRRRVTPWPTSSPPACTTVSGSTPSPTPAERRRVQRALREWHIEALAARRARELSYGQLRLCSPRGRSSGRGGSTCSTSLSMDWMRRRAWVCVRDWMRGAPRCDTGHGDPPPEDVPPYVQNVLRMRRGRAPVAARAEGAQSGIDAS